MGPEVLVGPTKSWLESKVEAGFFVENGTVSCFEWQPKSFR